VVYQLHITPDTTLRNCDFPAVNICVFSYSINIDYFAERSLSFIFVVETVFVSCEKGKTKKKLKVNNWKETAKDRRTWTYLAEKAKTQKVL